ncbi:MAG: hypothetical protein H6581_20740 [Bacteroidia bacterium]|nr:hypothetical protein [Bacteroidia bacterium]
MKMYAGRWPILRNLALKNTLGALLMLISGLLLMVGCRESKPETAEIPLPELTKILNSQILLLKFEHGIIFRDYEGNKAKADVSELISILSALKEFEIKKARLEEFTFQSKECGGKLTKTWLGPDFQLRISQLMVNKIRIQEINIRAEGLRAEFLFANDGPLDYLKVNEKRYQAIYESRMIGLDEAISLYWATGC